MSKAFQHFLESGKAMRWSFGLLGAGVAVGSFLSKVPEDHIGMVHHYGKGLEPEVLKPGWHITLPFYTTVMMVDRRETMSLGVPIGRGSKEVELILRPNYEFQVKRFRENGTLLGGYEQAKAEVGDIISRIVASNAGEEEVKALLQEALPPVFESYGFILEDLDVVD